MLGKEDAAGAEGGARLGGVEGCLGVHGGVVGGVVADDGVEEFEEVGVRGEGVWGWWVGRGGCDGERGLRGGGGEVGVEVC